MKFLLVPLVLFIIILGGYLAACAGAGKRIGFIDWLIAPYRKNKS